MAKPTPKRSYAPRHLSRAEKHAYYTDRRGPDECWPWKGGLSDKGYGRFTRYPQPQTGAHRASYEIYIGPIPAGLGVLHKCDNPACVNPKHLFLGTQGDNNTDRMKKGRNGALYGVHNGRAKLNDKLIGLMRSRKTPSLRKLAEEFGVTKSTAHRVRNNKAWRHVP